MILEKAPEDGREGLVEKRMFTFELTITKVPNSYESLTQLKLSVLQLVFTSADLHQHKSHDHFFVISFAYKCVSLSITKMTLFLTYDWSFLPYDANASWRKQFL